MTRLVDRLRPVLVAGLIAILSAAVGSHPATAHGPADDIRHVMMATFDKPEAPLVVDPIAVAGEWAIAGWTQDGRGGRALLKSKGHAWAIHLCAGDALKDVEALKAMGLPANVAATLAADLATAEAAADPARVALFSTFDGIVEMGTDGTHPVHGEGDAAGHGGHSTHTN